MRTATHDTWSGLNAEAWLPNNPMYSYASNSMARLPSSPQTQRVQDPSFRRLHLSYIGHPQTRESHQRNSINGTGLCSYSLASSAHLQTCITRQHGDNRTAQESDEIKITRLQIANGPDCFAPASQSRHSRHARVECEVPWRHL